MVVSSMSYEELLNEVTQDRDNVFCWVKHQKKVIERVARKQTKFPCSYFMDYTSVRKNRWLVCVRIFRRQVHGGGAGIQPLMLQKCPKGYAVHSCVLDRYLEKYVMTVLPHVFDQYAGRMNVNKTGIDLIKHFFARNVQSENDFTPECAGRKARERETIPIHMCTDEGVLMGEVISSEHVVLHTFVTYDMATGKQKRCFDERKSLLSDDVGRKHRDAWYGRDDNAEWHKILEAYGLA